MAKKAESGGYARLKGDLAQKTPGSFYVLYLSLIHISEPTRRVVHSYAVFC